MAEAEVGDDQYGEDPTVNALEEQVAALLGKPAALFTPSGTMANQIALRVLCRPGDAVVAGARQHIVAYELGAAAINAGVSWLTLPDDDGTLDPAAIERAAIGPDYHLPRPTLVAIEDTHMAAGGAVWSLERLDQLTATAAGAGLAVHLDGARLWHASAASGVELARRTRGATTVMCCLSKGLGAPVGSVLAGPAAVIAQARIERHRLGGAMRQAGVLAAAGLVALSTMLERLVDDHRRARRLAEAVAERWPACELDPESVTTNIVVFSHPDPPRLIAELATRGVLAGAIAPRCMRLVTHADVGDDGIDQACMALAQVPGP
jgi:threonine aldolase